MAAVGYSGRERHWLLQLCDPWQVIYSTLIKTSSFICENEVNTKDYLTEIEWDNAWNTLDT